MSKYRLNEIVLCVKSGTPKDWDFGAEERFGEECKIIGLYTSYCGPMPRHRVEFSDGVTAQMTEDFLRKRPDDQPFSEWFRNTIITDLTDAPLETTMRNVARNLQKFTEAGHGS